MEIVWLGHSSLKIRTGGTTLITDPFKDSLGLSMGPQKADIVTISHPHPHHSNLDGVEKDARVIDGPGEYEIASFYVSGLGTAREESQEEGLTNTVYNLQAEGLTLCHLGDLTRLLTPRQIEHLGQTDLLFVPAGGACTVTTSQAAELVNLLSPRIVVPIHYHIEGVAVELGPLEAFLEELGLTEVTNEPKLTVTSSNLPRDQQVVVLDRAS